MLNNQTGRFKGWGSGEIYEEGNVAHCEAFAHTRMSQ